MTKLELFSLHVCGNHLVAPTEGLLLRAKVIDGVDEAEAIKMEGWKYDWEKEEEANGEREQMTGQISQMMTMNQLRSTSRDESRRTPAK